MNKKQILKKYNVYIFTKKVERHFKKISVRAFNHRHAAKLGEQKALKKWRVKYVYAGFTTITE